jgi:histidyl-tRNA synthetase
VAVGDLAARESLVLAETLRGAAPGVRIQVNLGGGSIKAQFKRADKSGARYALILGDEEVQDGTIGIKSLRTDQAQTALSRQALCESIKDFL